MCEQLMHHTRKASVEERKRLVENANHRAVGKGKKEKPFG